MSKNKKVELFRDVKNPALRGWNQLSKVRDLAKSVDKERAEAYLALLTRQEKENLYVLAAVIEAKGYDYVLKEVLRLSKEG